MMSLWRSRGEWRKCPACDGTGRKQAEGKLEAEQSDFRLAALVAQGICLACEGRGGFMAEWRPAIKVK